MKLIKLPPILPGELDLTDINQKLQVVGERISGAQRKRETSLDRGLVTLPVRP